jgi:hypothetical protein
MKILLKNQGKQLNITSHIEADLFGYPEPIQSEIDTLWEKKLQEAHDNGQKIWEDTQYCLLSFYGRDNTVSLQMGITKYRNIALKKFLSETSKQAIHERQARGMFVAGIVKTSDNYYLFPRRTANVLKGEQKKLSTFG